MIFGKIAAILLCSRDAKVPPTFKLLAGVARGGFFRLSRFLSRLVIGLHPFGVKNAGLVDAFVSVSAEEVALRL